MTATRTMRPPAMALATVLLLAAQLVGQTADKHPRVDENLSRAVHHQLQALPYYSVFDNLAYTIDGSRVTLTGQVVRPTLKEQAEAAVQSIEGVASVLNAIEVLPKSATDNELRRDVYRAIFEDAALKQYAVEPLPSIHIIVKDGVVTLEGGTNSKADKDLANTKARAVQGVRTVVNHLLVRDKLSAAK